MSRQLPVRVYTLFLAFGLSIPSANAQNTIRVPGDQPSIQAGINAAANGDTVLVAPGTYLEDITLLGKSSPTTRGRPRFPAAN
jgi:hypothetical protein